MKERRHKLMRPLKLIVHSARSTDKNFLQEIIKFEIQISLQWKIMLLRLQKQFLILFLFN